MKTMTVKWAEAAIEQAVQRLEEVVKAGDPERAYQVAGMPLSWMDLACLLDIVRQCDSQHSPIREQLLAALPDEWDTDQPTLADVADAVRDKLKHRTADCERVLEALLPVLREHPLSKDDMQGDNLRPGDIAKAAAEALQWQTAEIDRLTAEVERLRADLAAWTSGRRRKAWPRIESVPDGIHYAAELVRAQGTEGGDDHDQLLREASQRLKALHDVATVLLADRDVLSAEVSRLREQLAAQPPSDLVERAAIWLFRAKTSQMLPDVLQRATTTWRQVLDQHDRDAWCAYAREMLADLGWGVSSSEVEAPQPANAEEADAVMEALKERDDAVEWADKLAYAVAPVEVIGEHSNDNNPWANALSELEISGYLTVMPKRSREARSTTSETSIARTRPPYPYEARQWAEDGARVECFSGRDPSHVVHEGWIIGMTEAPTVRVQKDDGQIVSWVLGITRRQDAQKADRG